jgi:hypothetical protein
MELAHTLMVYFQVLGKINATEFPDQLHNYQLLKTTLCDEIRYVPLHRLSTSFSRKGQTRGFPSTK